MLSIQDTRLNHHCQGFSRREFLRVGSLGAAGLGMGGLNLAGLMQAQAKASTVDVSLTGRSVVFLFLQGGPPHIEFFDPKMTAPVEIHSVTGEIQTNTPGITFGSTFPKLARRTQDFSIVRSYGSANGGHTYASVTTAKNPLEASMSSIYARVRGNNHPDTGMPTNVLLLPEAVQEGLKLGSNFETGALPTLTQPGKLGSTYAAFNPSGGGQLQQDMELKIPAPRLSDRKTLLGQLDNYRRATENSGQLDGISTYQQQAFDVITRGVANAFDLTKEDPATLAKYDTSHIFKQEDLQKYYDMRRVSNQLGKQMLLARRLCEAGCGFVTVSDCGWDYHANNNSPKNMAGIWPMGNQVDHAVAAFIDDVRERGLSEKILLVVTGEMGRNPRINNGGGRDHYGDMTTLLMSGGGLKMGQVIGQSDHQAAKPITTPYRPAHLMATVMHSLFNLGELRLVQGLPREILEVTETGEPIPELI